MKTFICAVLLVAATSWAQSIGAGQRYHRSIQDEWTYDGRPSQALLAWVQFGRIIRGVPGLRLTSGHPTSGAPAARETARLSRNNDFGVNAMSGRLGRAPACERRRWKKFPGVLQIATRMLLPAQSCKNRSIRPDEWSGPWPSRPCGRSTVNPDVSSHLSSPLAMN